ncbi:hypothetical protein AB0L61_39475 [Streptomyces tendae]|uniref:hypothetical protein n=1 Tax=Streptomyces tendae TaxID=1932 RepID=UPI00342EE5D7
MQPGNRRSYLVLVVADGVVEDESEVQSELGVRHARCTDVGAQHLGAVVDVGVGAASVAGERRDVGDQGGGAQIHAGQKLLGEGEFAVGGGRVGEGQGEDTVGMAVAAFPGDTLINRSACSGSSYGRRKDGAPSLRPA